MEWLMVNDFDTNAAARERLSALADGELADGAVAQAVAAWRQSAELRAAWHAHQLIGDVLRSEDLASDTAHDAGFLASFRLKLANEPVVLAPHAAAARDAAASTLRRPRGWMTPTAVAAGFVAVAGVLTLTRPSPAPDRPAAETIAQAAPTASKVASGRVTAAPANPATVVVEPPVLITSGQVVRDARLERYLAAHKQFAGSSALGVPSPYLRNATAEVAGR
jgi:sigma-E factor negative regulatory protein RseA